MDRRLRLFPESDSVATDPSRLLVFPRIELESMLKVDSGCGGGVNCMPEAGENPDMRLGDKPNFEAKLVLFLGDSVAGPLLIEECVDGAPLPGIGTALGQDGGGFGSNTSRLWHCRDSCSSLSQKRHVFVVSSKGLFHILSRAGSGRLFSVMAAASHAAK